MRKRETVVQVRSSMQNVRYESSTRCAQCVSLHEGVGVQTVNVVADLIIRPVMDLMFALLNSGEKPLAHLAGLFRPAYA